MLRAAPGWLWAGIVFCCLWPCTASAQVPPTDPNVPPGQVVPLLPGVDGEHPRLLFTPGQLTAIRQYALTPGNPFYQQLLGYLGSSRPPTDTTWLSNDTEAQRQGYWRLPTVALHYLITGSSTSFTRAKGFLDAFLAQPHWQTGVEQDSGMGAANIMLGAAIAYDCLYDNLTPAYRQQFHDKLLLQARDMYYLGHGQQNADSHYWQQDPQNNHRWHRDAGLALAVLAVADGNDPADQWILKQTKDELDFLARWLPADGSTHEGPGYAVFGEDHLTLAFAAADRVLGTSYMSNPFFTNAANYRIATLTPGLKNVFNYGDASPGSLGYFNNYLFAATAVNHQADQQAALMRMYNQNSGDFSYGWMSLVFIDPNLTGGSVNNLPKKQYFPDMGFGVVRDGWESNNVAMFFKCSPYGGAALNEYRNENGYHYINVAHDDPDAGGFQIYARGQMLARADGYSYTKLTSGQNTILVNGKGQKGEGSQWTQPLSGADRDMTKLASITWFEDRGETTILEGEAGGAYAGLSRFRRTTAFVQGKYILILDDIRAPLASNITWLVQSDAVDVLDGAHGKFALRAGGGLHALPPARRRQLLLAGDHLDGRRRRGLDGPQAAPGHRPHRQLALGRRLRRLGTRRPGPDLDSHQRLRDPGPDHRPRVQRHLAMGLHRPADGPHGGPGADVPPAAGLCVPRSAAADPPTARPCLTRF